MSGSTIIKDEVGWSRTSGSNEPGHYMLTIESFSLLSDAGVETFESDVFEVSGYKWKLRLYPNGNRLEDGENYISLYLLIVETSSLPKGWDIHVYLKFLIYDHIRGNYLTIQGDGMKRRFHEKKLEWGFSKAISINTFKDDSNGYLFQDNCVIGAEVLVIPKFVQKENCFSIIKPPVHSNSYTWIIDNFSDIVAESVNSEEFKVGKLKWMIRLYPNGGLEEKGTHLSLFLEVQSLPLGWRCYVERTLRILDQAGSDHIEHKGNGSNSNAIWGSRRFMPLKDVNDKAKSFLVNNKLIVQVEIGLLGVLKTVT